MRLGMGRGLWRLGRVMWASRWSLIGRVGLLAGLVAASGLATDCPQLVWLPVVGLGLVVTRRWLCQGPAMLGSVVCQRDGSRVELEAAPGPEGRIAVAR